MIKRVGDYFIPVLLTSLIVKGGGFGMSVPESLTVGFLSAVYGLQLWFYLKRLHQVDTKKLARIQAEIKELKTQMSSVKLLSAKAQPQTMPGNMPWPR
jgi:hypothetical protein